MLAVALLHLIGFKAEIANANDLIQKVNDSGRCVTLSESPDEKIKDRLKIAPGPPPLLIFRYYEGKTHHRFGNDDLMLDDAGH